MGRVVFNFLPKAVNIYHDRILVDDGVAPDHLIDHILGENAVDVVQEELHHRILLGCQIKLLSVLIKPQCAGIINKGAGLDRILPAMKASLVPPDHGLDLGSQGNRVQFNVGASF